MAVELYPHQEKAVKELKNGSILWGGVGTGKTMTALAYYVANEAPRDIYVITTAKKRNDLDWQREATYFGILLGEKSGPNGALHVDSWNNIKKYLDVEGAFFIFDEQHASGSGAWAKTFVKLAKKNRWILLSGTPGDEWLHYAPIFIANGYYRNISDFKDQHCVYSYFGGYPQLKRYIGERKLARLREAVRVEMDFVAHTKRHISYVKTAYDEETYKLIMRTRRDPETDEPYINASGFVQGLRKASSTHPERIAEVERIALEKKRVIIFYAFNYEREILREWSSSLGSGWELGEYNGERHDDIPEGDRWVYLVQYNLSEAWNCTTTDSMIFYSPTGSYRMFEQCMGRIDRMNTPYTDLYYYVLLSDSPVDRRTRKALERREEFNYAPMKKWFKDHMKEV